MRRSRNELRSGSVRIMLLEMSVVRTVRLGNWRLRVRTHPSFVT